jgi:hypothetical protein
MICLQHGVPLESYEERIGLSIHRAAGPPFPLFFEQNWKKNCSVDGHDHPLRSPAFLIKANFWNIVQTGSTVEVRFSLFQPA